jgi:acyl-coenzyme A synthetase/AMP-(fatty) acid ligase
LWSDASGLVFATVSHQHIYGMLFRIFCPVLSGRVSANRAAVYWEQLSNRLVPGTTLVASPAHLNRLPDRAVLGAVSPTYVFSSGGALSYEAAQGARELLGAQPIEVFGCTETGGIAWRRQASRNAPWTSLPNVQVTIDSDESLLVLSPYSGSSQGTVTGDRAKYVDGGFELLGRADRVVKAEGKRVSLVRLEDALRAHASVADATATLVPIRSGVIGAIVELTAAGEKEFDEMGSFRFGRKLRLDLSATLDVAELPRQWRFRPLPSNAQGKRTDFEIRELFLPAPAAYFGNSTVDHLGLDTAEINLVLDERMVWFEGHFPDRPILPGIAQVHLARRWSERIWGWVPDRSCLTHLKFRHLLRPDNVVRVKLFRDRDASRLRFEYHLDDAVASSGTIGGRR